MITDNYKELNRKLHDADPYYGTSGQKYAEYIRQLSDWGRGTVLDYGAGKCTLKQALGPAYSVTCYDPCVPGLDTKPQGTFHTVACTDVMEHIEPEYVMDVLKDVRKYAAKYAFFAIAVTPARKKLEDGRNAHVSLKTPEEWKALVTQAGFEIESAHDDDGKHSNFGLVCR